MKTEESNNEKFKKLSNNKENNLIEKSLFIRENVNLFNEECEMNQVFFYNNNNNEKQCGECIPLNFQSTNKQKTFACQYNNKNLQQCDPININTNTNNNLYTIDPFCPLNHYCNENGKCTHLNKQLKFGKQCETSNDCGRNENNQLPLYCINSICSICRNNMEITNFGIHEYEYLRNHSNIIIDRMKNNNRIRLVCVSGELYSPTQNPNSFIDTNFLFTVTIVFIVILKTLLYHTKQFL
jgi:hypothetical protein